MKGYLTPFTPGKAQPWNRPRAGHLLRRAGFAPTEQEVQAALETGLAATVDRLLEDGGDSERHDELDTLGERIALGSPTDAGSLRPWWLLRACRTEKPLHLRMTLFWQDHFATSNTKVRNTSLMLGQQRTIERHALGRFEDLLLALSKDPAMILWLDGDQNVRGRPNENYARELFELFALGVGHYSETDIREAARAFTGWHQHKGSFRFAERDHDPGGKTVLGCEGNLNGDDVVRLCVEHPACSRHLASKLAREFLAPHPPPGLVEEIAARLRETGFDLRAVMRALLTSEALFEPGQYRSRIKSPVELAVGIVRSLEMRAPGEALARAVSQMGQRLFEPPSVKGWESHRSWLNSATMLVRLNAALSAVEPERMGKNHGLQPRALLRRYGLEDREAVLSFCKNLALDGELPPALDEELNALEGSLEETMREAFRLLLTSPEYQMA